MAEPWASAPVVAAGLPPCPKCGHPGEARYGWVPFVISHIRVRTEGSKRWMKCCRCSARFYIDFGPLDSPVGNEQ